MSCKHKSSDLKHWITIKSRAIKGLGSGLSATETFADKPQDVPAKIKTFSGKTVFDGINQDKDVTHEFVIRYNDYTTSESWIEYKNKNFDILKVENLDEEYEWLEILATEKGLANNPVAHA